MGALEVRYAGQLVVVTDDERLGFGRANTDPGGRRGWGYEGRFLDLSPKPHVHRLWAEVTSDGRWWRVRSLGSLHPVVVESVGRRPVELAPLRDGAAPQEHVVTEQSFDLVLTVAADTFRIACRRSDAPDPVATLAPELGSHTTTLCDEMAECVTATEFPVVWVMARDYRTDPPPPMPEPVSYARIRRTLDLSEKQVVSAVARVVGRFRSRGLMPDEVPAERQRDWICRHLVAHGVLDELSRRHGTPVVD